MKKAYRNTMYAAAIVVGLLSCAALMLPALTRAREQYRGTSGAPVHGTARSYDLLYSGGTGWDAGYPSGGGTARSYDLLYDDSQETPDFILKRTEEIWVIAKPPAEAGPAEDIPGSGALMAKLPGVEKKVPVPLKHTDVKAEILGYIATVEVTQQYENPYNEKIEAEYVFPLPQNAAVNEFTMTVGDRRIHGYIREREKAEKIYQEARSQGYVASLLTQERPNIFTQKVANIEPSKEIDINIKYFHTLAYADGWYEYVFPMVVGPRYNPPAISDGVGAVARGHYGASGQATEVQYLKPNERSGHDISLAVDINAGVAIEEARSTSHVVTKTQPSPERMHVALGELDTIPNKDFVLRYKVAGKAVKSAVLTSRDERGGFFTLMIYPPDELASIARKPMEMVFVLDCSGSMSGEPIAQAKAAVERALKSMVPDDTFQVIRFSNDSSKLGPAPVAATAENVERGLKYLKSLKGQGGTEMIEGIKAALDFPHDPRRLRVVTFLTDGYIGNEDEILLQVNRRLGATRIFSFGVGTTVNRYLLSGLARMGKGAVAYLNLTDSAADVMDRYFERISHPAMMDISIDWGGMNVRDVYPGTVPDLFVGRAVVLTGRFDGTGKSEIRIRAGEPAHMPDITLPVDLDSPPAHKGLASVWARTKIADLSDSLITTHDKALAEEIKKVALDFELMSAYTAFVAVDSSTKTAGDHGTTVAVPAPVPDGVKYETTVVQ